MNKEVIKKYKDVFNYWLVGGKVWVKQEDMCWTLATSLHWNKEGIIYVQDDEYSDLRKKICDLKQELDILKGQIR